MVDSPELYLGSNSNSWNNVSLPDFGGANMGTVPSMPGIDFSFPQMPSFAGLPQNDEKVGFWEGLKAFGKGLIKPLVNIIKHPIKSALMIGGAALLIIGTGGAATPFLVAAGLAIGGFQLAKGTYNSFSKDTRAEKLAALEDIGEGTFTVLASLAGARSYAKGTPGGSAVTKNLAAAGDDAGICARTSAVVRGLAQDSVTCIKDTPGAVRQTYSMVRSGEFLANIRTAYGSSRLALSERSLDAKRGELDTMEAVCESAEREYAAHSSDASFDPKQLRLEHDALIKQQKALVRARNAYNKAGSDYWSRRSAYGDLRGKLENGVLDRYVALEKGRTGESLTYLWKNFDRFSEGGFAEVGNIHELYSHMNILKNDPGINIAMGIGSMFNSDVNPQALAMAQAAGFNPMDMMGFDPVSMSGISPSAMGMDPASLAGLA